MNLKQKLAELKKRDHLAEDGGGSKRREKQNKEGKMSARERIEFLLRSEERRVGKECVP